MALFCFFSFSSYQVLYGLEALAAQIAVVLLGGQTPDDLADALRVAELDELRNTLPHLLLVRLSLPRGE